MSAAGDIKDLLEKVADGDYTLRERSLILDRVGTMWSDDLTGFEQDLKDDAEWWGEKAIAGYQLLAEAEG